MTQHKTAVFPPLERSIWTALWMLAGIIPSAAFFIWIERNATLPWIPIRLNWPWIDLSNAPIFASHNEWSLVTLCAFDLALILIFGFFHSLLAQPATQSGLSHLTRWFRPQTYRAFYIILTGLLLLGIMGCWQSTGLILWSSPLPRSLPVQWTYALSILFYWGLLAIAFYLAQMQDFLEFLGLRGIWRDLQNKSDAPLPHPLVKTGIYAWVRHPMYLFTLAAFLVTPVMSLDRMLVFLGSVFYLSIGIPIEERKLIREFGDDYVRYRNDVPAVIPKPPVRVRAR